MASRFESFVALRYLRGAEGRDEGKRFLQFITYVAIGGVAVGVAALLLALAIVRGFSQEIEEKIVGFGAHIHVSSFLQDEALSDASQKQQRLQSLPGVTRAAPVVEGFALLRRSSTAIDGVVLVGVDAPPPYLAAQLTEGAFRLDAPAALPSLIVGTQLAERLQVAVGDTVTAFTLRNGASAPSSSAMQLQRPRVKQFRVSGTYATSLPMVDDLYVFTNLDTARQLAGLSEATVSRFDVTLQDVTRADSVAATIENKFGFPVAAQTIYERFSGLFAWVNLQEGIVPLVIGVIILVAAFNIVGTLLMLILEKTREIGVLKSLGASQQLIERLFLAFGVFVGGIGTALGAALAAGLGLLQQTYEIIPLPAQAYYMTTAPVELNPVDFVLVAVVSVVLCGLAAYIPARVAARIEPVQSIQFR